MSKNYPLQVKEGHYIKRSYNTLERFISYYFQIKSVTTLQDIRSVFEIGPGSKLVSRELQSLGYQVTTCDFDESVKPDVVADVRSIPVPDNAHDVVMACQILEHIPFKDFPKALQELDRISKKFVIVSLPERSSYFEFVFKFPFIRKLCKKHFIDLWFSFPVRFPGFLESGQHYWEIDFWLVSRKQVRKHFEKHFIIIDEFSPPLNKYHRFFILEKQHE